VRVIRDSEEASVQISSPDESYRDLGPIFVNTNDVEGR
jgi:hypothetical protein